jgi:hypothetical protein
MEADLDSLLTVVFCTADDLLPTKAANARRMVTDTERLPRASWNFGDGSPGLMVTQ